MSDDFDLRLRNELQALSEAVPVKGPQATMPHGRSAAESGRPIVAHVRARHGVSVGSGAAFVALAVVVVAGIAIWGGQNVVPASSADASFIPDAPASGCLVGEAWNNYAEKRYRTVGPAGAREADPGRRLRLRRGRRQVEPETQAAQIDQFVAEGAKVIIARPSGGYRLRAPNQSAIDRAVAPGVAVIAYDDLIDNPKVL